jgi:hypothetical protein
MRKALNLIILLAFLFAANPLLWAQEGEKGASEKAYEHASENAIFNRISDWFATVGKSPEEKEAILTERKAQRAAKRAEKKASQVKERGRKEASEVAEEVEKQAKAAKPKVKMEKGKPIIQQEAPSIEEEVPSIQQEAPNIEEEVPSIQQEAPSIEEEAPNIQQ